MDKSPKLPNLVLAALGAGTWDMDVARSVVRHNAVLAELAGFSDGLLMRPLADFLPRMHPDEAPLVMQKLQDACVNGRTYSSVHRIFRPDGTFLWLQDLGRVIERDATGRAIRMVGAARDITEEVNTRQRLAETEAFFADLVESVPGAILRFWVQQDGQIHLHYISPRCEEIWEVPARDLLADSGQIRGMMRPEDAERMRAAILALKETSALLDMKISITTPSNRAKDLHFFGVPSSRTGTAITWTVLAVDITAQTRLEEELRKSREIILHGQKVEAIGSLTGGIAHDFNNLLAVILGNLELAKEDRAGAEAEAFLDEAISATLRGGELTRSLLSYARKAPLEPVVLNLNEVVRGLDKILRRTLPETIALQTVEAGGLWPVLADRNSTETAVLNLVINARDAMPEGGKITIELANIRLSDEYVADRAETIPSGRYVMLAVTDTGCGMAPEILDHIFEPFFTTKPIGKGTGLGLSSVMGFAKQSGGTVRVYSEVGVGTTFKLYFHVATKLGAERDPAEPMTAFMGQRGRVLLVEDEAAVRRVIKSRLQFEGYVVCEAENADMALRVFEAEAPFDLILTDIVMPGTLPGTGLVRELRKRDPALKAIFMSGYPNEAAIHGNGLRIEDVKLMKPVSRIDLLKALAKCLSGP